MDATTFKQKAIVEYMNQKYYAVKFDAETRDTINFNGHSFINSDPSFVKEPLMVEVSLIGLLIQF